MDKCAFANIIHSLFVKAPEFHQTFIGAHSLLQTIKHSSMPPLSPRSLYAREPLAAPSRPLPPLAYAKAYCTVRSNQRLTLFKHRVHAHRNTAAF